MLAHPMILSSALANTLNAQYPGHQYSLGNAHTRYPISAFITDVVYLTGGKVPIDILKLTVNLAHLTTHCTRTHTSWVFRS